jgi:hypothetical protein
MAYIDREVRATCLEKQWGFQIRRKWSVRDKPISESAINDYEWKLIPHVTGALTDEPASPFDEGIYYVLSCDRSGGRFVLQHDTRHCGMMGPHWSRCTYTEINIAGAPGGAVDDIQQPVTDTTLEHRREKPPPAGWLREHLVDLTSRFEPNHFSVT